MSLKIIGQIGSPVGVRGWVTVHSFTHPKTNILQYQPWKLSTDMGWEVAASDQMIRGKAIVARFAGCDDRDAAAGLTHRMIAVERSQFPPLGDQQYYWSDLEGLTVVNHQGTVLGKVDHLMPAGSHDVLVVEGACPCLIPFVLDEVVQAVDIEAGLIAVCWSVDD